MEEARLAVTQKSDEIAIETPKVSGYHLDFPSASCTHVHLRDLEWTLVPHQLLTQ
jgi:hypothetical protein